MKKTSVALLWISLLSLAACLCLHWRISTLEAEQERIYQQIYRQQIVSTHEISKGVDISRELHGRYGLYSYRNRTAACAALSGFAFLCVNLERLKEWLYREKKSAPGRKKQR